MPRAIAGDVEIEYDVAALYDDDPPLVLIAGLGSQLVFFEDEFVQGLVDRAFRVIRIDNRDVGLSTWVDAPPVDLDDVRAAVAAGAEPAVPYTLGDMAGDVVAVLDDLGVARAHVFGVSLGGMIAQVMAAESPDRVRSLTLLSTTSGAGDVGHPTPEALAALVAPPLPAADPVAAVEADVAARAVWATEGHHDEDWTRAYFQRCHERGHNPAGVVRQMAAGLISGDREASLGRLDIPTLVLHGTDDKLINVDAGHRLAEVIPGAELVELEGMGHDLPPHFWAPIIEAVTQLAIRAR